LSALLALLYCDIAQFFLGFCWTLKRRDSCRSFARVKGDEAKERGGRFIRFSCRRPFGLDIDFNIHTRLTSIENVASDGHDIARSIGAIKST